MTNLNTLPEILEAPASFDPDQQAESPRVIETGLVGTAGATHLNVYEYAGYFVVEPVGEVENADLFAFVPQTDGDVTGMDPQLEALAVYLGRGFYPVVQDLDVQMQSKVHTTLANMGYDV